MPEALLAVKGLARSGSGALQSPSMAKNPHAVALGRKGGVGRSYADAPEIDGTVKLLPPAKASKTLKVGEFTKARIVGAQGHDLIGEPI